MRIADDTEVVPPRQRPESWRARLRAGRLHLSRRPSPVLELALLFGLALAGWAAAAESVTLQLLPAEPALFESADRGAAIEPGPGDIVILGRFNDPRFSAGSITNLSLATASGEAIPLLVDGASVLKEFGRIISLRLGAVIPARLRADGKDPALVLAWGPDVSGQNRVADGFRLAPERDGQVRGFVWNDARAGPGAGGEPVTGLTVTLTAERGAELHKYWYLIPLGLVFVLLSIRKIAASLRSSGPPAGAGRAP